MKNLATAIINVMKEVKGIDKSMTVGSGNSAYKGVPDQEVKKIIGEAMQKNGLCILPIGVTPKTEVSRWEEVSTWNGQETKKQKQSVFTEATTKYLLLHESGESVELEGYGHGVDSQDKGAGKATTYALKYTLLYTFLVPTGKIDDADATHSDDADTPKGKKVTDPTTDEKVASMLKKPVGKRSTTEIPTETLDAINAASTTAELAKIYNECSDLQPNEEFTVRLTERRNQIKSQKTAA